MAAVILADRATATEAELLAGPRAVLSPFKVPRRILIRGAFPRGAAGKVRRADLSALCLADLRAAATQIRPLAPREAALAALWCDVLGLDAVDPELDFFLAGGNSLKAAALVARVNSAFGIALELQCVFDDAKTVAAMAAAVEAAQRAARPGLPCRSGGFAATIAPGPKDEGVCCRLYPPRSKPPRSPTG